MEGSIKAEGRDVVPSPYLNGMLDKFLDGKFTPVFETSRGCPFLCTFCDQGLDETKITAFSTLRCADEIRYVGERVSKIKDGMNLEELIPETFAYVREAARRTLGERHYDVQLMGGIILHQGKIAEMKTGEGKTLVSTLPVYLNALTKKGVHIVTVNDYLAKRDSECCLLYTSDAADE